MTDNTQELDKMVAIFQDHAASNGYPMNDEHKRGAEIHKQAILDWHNKKVEELLDRLEAQFVEEVVVIFGKTEVKKQVPLSAIEAERNKLKENQ